MITECEKSERLTVEKLNTVKQYNKQDHKSNYDRKIFIVTIKSSTINTSTDSYTKDVRKTPGFEIEPVNSIRPLEIEIYTNSPGIGTN